MDSFQMYSNLAALLFLSIEMNTLRVYSSAGETYKQQRGGDQLPCLWVRVADVPRDGGKTQVPPCSTCPAMINEIAECFLWSKFTLAVTRYPDNQSREYWKGRTRDLAH